jgi:maltooligosyltrehalose trehalohydrolase
MIESAHAMPFGAQLLPAAGARFRLWAPSCERVELELTTDAGVSRHRMNRLDAGWHELILPETPAGTRYQFVVTRPDSPPLTVPDPASRSNPDGVHAASAVVDPCGYAWREPAWTGRPWSEAVLYELHVGTFTPAGTFQAAIERLPELAALGITALQLMPVAAFPGTRGWGYDGVLPYAPAACYGSPDEFKALIDAAHAHGLMVLLDVVYNHFGPDGNYLHAYCPEFFNPAHRTPWGAAINFDGPHSRTVRDFFVHNALFWVEEYRIDGLRLDAVHALRDQSRPDIVGEIAQALREQGRRSEAGARHIHLTLENNANQSHYLERTPDGAAICATAQWDDDVHHALHVLTSAESDGYYADYAAAPLKALGRSLAEGFAYQGEYSQFRQKPRGEPSGHLPPAAFVAFLQNHDMIGNRAFGGRIHEFADAQLLPAAYACVLLTPHVPMLFMGEEYAASTPFLYFCDFDGELARSVADGRRREFARFAAFADEAARASIPDPNAALTFSHSKLDWEERHRPPHRGHLAFIRELLTLRRRHLTPRLTGVRHGGRYRIEDALLTVVWDLPDGGCWRLLTHFGGTPSHLAEVPPGGTIFESGVHRDAAGGARLLSGAVLICAGTADPAV